MNEIEIQSQIPYLDHGFDFYDIGFNDFDLYDLDFDDLDFDD